MKMEIIGTFMLRNEGLAKGKPRWVKRSFVADDGTVFMPAALGGDETRMFLLACFDSVPFIKDSGHLYLPLDWLEKTAPDGRWKNIRRKIKDAIRPCQQP